MRRLAVTIVAVIVAGVGVVAIWRRNPRIGSGRMNRIVDPVLMRRGIAGGGRSEVGIIEHVGRRSGVRRLTPIHAISTDDGFRIVVPLGLQSQWARNVLAAGHCRMQLHDVVYELDEPQLLAPHAMQELSGLARLVTGRLGFLYLRLHRFAEHPGRLEKEPAATESPADLAGATAEPAAVAAGATA